MLCPLCPPQAADAAEAAAWVASALATPTGTKKVLPAELPKGYMPRAVEAGWYEWWEQCGYFKADLNSGAWVGWVGRRRASPTAEAVAFGREGTAGRLLLLLACRCRLTLCHASVPACTLPPVPPPVPHRQTSLPL